MSQPQSRPQLGLGSAGVSGGGLKPPLVDPAKTEPRLKTVTAIEIGFYDGSRVRVGQSVRVPVDFKASWCTDTSEAERIISKRKAEEAAQAIGKAMAGQAPRARHRATLVSGKEDLLPGSDLA